MKYFLLLIAPIEGFISLLDNENDRNIDVTAILFLLVHSRQHMTEPWLDQALMEYRSDYIFISK